MTQEPGRGGPIGPLDWRKILPFEPCAASDRRGWAGLGAARFQAASAPGLNVPPLTHHPLLLISPPPGGPPPRRAEPGRETLGPAGQALPPAPPILLNLT